MVPKWNIPFVLYCFCNPDITRFHYNEHISLVLRTLLYNESPLYTEKEIYPISTRYMHACKEMLIAGHMWYKCIHVYLTQPNINQHIWSLTRKKLKLCIYIIYARMSMQACMSQTITSWLQACK